MKTKKLLSLAAAAILLFSTSCRNDEEIYTELPTSPKGAYENGILISNEGNFGTPSGTASYISKDLGTVQNNIYAANNSGANLGDIFQSIAFNGDNAYLVLNNSNKIEIVNRYTFKKTATLTQEINQPRYIAFNGNYTYVSNDKYLGAKYLSIYNNADNSFVKKITFTDAAEVVVSAGSKVFVQNSTYGYGNKISMIDALANSLEKTITLPNGDLNEIVSYNGNVYAIAYTSTDSYIYKIDTAGNIVNTKTLTGIANGDNLEIYQDKFYFSSDTKVYTMDINSTVVPTTTLFTVAFTPYSSLYGFNVIDGKIYTSDANSFTQNSTVTVYSLTGAVLKTFTTGIGTNGFYQN
ncbi:hypothetical protein [Frigoriflavimonas asaccharolytica]|uniref:Uncharacterized protein n=1 Tax=Frigoriflavimonas asaccharolytica TaxID=2735899 RepID=A0A8J8K855_9FLAO|nr:hypothetical protein [Frigoriflavimonas asaccharolytica]NRS92236.1 hypothetical protein [Frigoriflavimonas asaccharolytica]